MKIRFAGHIYDATLTTAHPSSHGVPVLLVGGEPFNAHDIALNEVDLLLASVEERDDFAEFMRSASPELRDESPSDIAGLRKTAKDE